MPFKSKAQMRLFFAKEKAGELPKGTAKKWAHETGSISALPEKVKRKRVSEAAMSGGNIVTSGRSIIEEWATEHGVDPIIESNNSRSTSGRTILEAFVNGQKPPFLSKQGQTPPPQEEAPPEEEQEQEAPPEQEQEVPPEEAPQGQLQTLEISVDADGNIVDGPEGLIGLNVAGPSAGAQPPAPGMGAQPPAPPAPGMPGQPMPGQPMPGQPMPGQPMPGQPMPGQPAVPPMAMPRVPGEVATSPTRMSAMTQPPGFTPNSQINVGAEMGLNASNGFMQSAPSQDDISAAISKHAAGLSQNVIQVLNMAAQSPNVPLKQLMMNVQLTPDETNALKVAWYNIRNELTKPKNPIPFNPLLATPTPGAGMGMQPQTPMMPGPVPSIPGQR